MGDTGDNISIEKKPLVVIGNAELSFGKTFFHGCKNPKHPVVSNMFSKNCSKSLFRAVVLVSFCHKIIIKQKK